MAMTHTHYDNLKVTRNAPKEVIRAAYKTLSQKFHPDRNSGNSDAARIMSIINASYEVLSDPDKRLDYDRWLEQQKLKASQATNTSRPTTHPTPAPPLTPRVSDNGIFLHVHRHWKLYSTATVFFILAWTTAIPSSPQHGLKPYQSEPATVKVDYDSLVDDIYREQLEAEQKKAKSSTSVAPNGQPWPVSAGYVKGYKRLHTKGLSTVTVDNSQNDSDVFVKLVSLGGAKAYPVRQFFIPASGKFTIKKITAGSYDIRYRDIKNGSLSRSEAFNLEETATQNGTQFSNISMTLYKVQNGNMQTYGLSEAEF